MNSPSETSMVAISGQELQSLALEFEAPVDFVERLYESEAAKISQKAKIKTFIGVLTVSRVRTALRQHKNQR